MGNAFFIQQIPDHVGIDSPQTDVCPADGRDRPGGAPAVAVEHRQRPQVAGSEHVTGVDDLPQRIQVGAAVVVHDTLGPARRARGVVDRDRRAFVGHRPWQRVVVAQGAQLGVIDASDLR